MPCAGADLPALCRVDRRCRTGSDARSRAAPAWPLPCERPGDRQCLQCISGQTSRPQTEPRPRLRVEQQPDPALPAQPSRVGEHPEVDQRLLMRIACCSAEDPAARGRGRWIGGMHQTPHEGVERVGLRHQVRRVSAQVIEERLPQPPPRSVDHCCPAAGEQVLEIIAGCDGGSVETGEREGVLEVEGGAHLRIYPGAASRPQDTALSRRVPACAIWMLY